jgi:phage baseplate assembly protein gpV
VQQPRVEQALGLPGPQEIRVVVEKAARQQALLFENVTLKQQLGGRFGLESVVGRDHQMRAQFRQGKVIDRKLDDKQGPLVRVQYLDKQGLVSRWLPVKQFGSRSTMHLYVPKIGDDVNVNMLPNSSEDGFVDGSFFNKANPPPAGIDLDTRHYKTEDGTVIEYRETDSTFRLDVGGATARTGPRAGKAGGGAIVIVGDIQQPAAARSCRTIRL